MGRFNAKAHRKKQKFGKQKAEMLRSARPPQSLILARILPRIAQSGKAAAKRN
jgi:hypothetical protein